MFLIKGDLGRLLAHVDILEECTIRVMGLFLDSGAELEQVLGHLLLGSSENIDEPGKRYQL